MKRVAVLVLVAVAALVALGNMVGGLAGVEQASAGPDDYIVSGTLVPPGCDQLTPGQAKYPTPQCGNYLYQVHCQFVDSVGDDEVWDEWCLERGPGAKNDYPKPDVPDCDLQLAGEPTEVGMRCRDYLADTRCVGDGLEGDYMEEFCANVAPNAGPDPIPKVCNPDLAEQPSAEGKQCSERLKQRYCSGWNPGDNTGAQDLNDFCDKVVRDNPSCDYALADSAAYKACRDQLYASLCAAPGSVPPPTAIAFCQRAAKEIGDEEKARKEQEAKEGPSPGKPGDSSGSEDPGDSGDSGDPEDSGDSKDKKQPSPGSPNVVLELGREPACDRAAEFDEEVRRACAVTGSVMHTFPFANYGIDNNVSVDILEDDFWSGETPIMSLFQWLIVGFWQLLLWLVKVALLVVQWGFGVDPLTRSAQGIRDGVMGVFNMLGPGWRLTAFAVLGVWTFWTGIVRLQLVKTVTGIAGSVVLMGVAMWIIYNPMGTVGTVAKYANESSLIVLSATSSGKLASPGKGLAASQRTTFEQIIVGPWCGLMFGGQKACAEKTADGSMTRADLWLSLPANSTARGLLYKATKEGPEVVEDETDENLLGDFADAIGDGLCMYSAGLISSCEGDKDVNQSQTQEDREAHPEKAKQFDDTKARAMSLVKKDPGAVKLQGTDGVFTRAGLMIVIAIGIFGAVAFLLAIGVRLLTAGVIVLLLILLAPVMFVVAAFGEEGRRRFITWLRMLLGAAVAKLVYSLILGLALLVVSILNEIPLTPMGLIFPEQAAAAEPSPTPSASADWLGNWVLVSAFFWVAVVKLNALLGLFAPDPESERSNGLGAGAALFMGQRMVSQALHGAWQGATFLPRHAPRMARAAGREAGIRRTATEGAIRSQADDRLRDRNQAASKVEFAERGKQAERILDESENANPRRRLDLIDRAMQRNPSPQAQARLERQRRKAEKDLRPVEARERWARSERSRQSQGYQEPNEGELRERRAQRRRDVASWEKDGKSWSSERNRHWAGITDDQWRVASSAAANGNNEPMDSLRQRSEQALERDRRLLAWRDNRRPMTGKVRREALSEWGRGTFDSKGNFSGYGRNPELAARQRDERKAIRRERRRGRDNLWPRNR